MQCLNDQPHAAHECMGLVLGVDELIQCVGITPSPKAWSANNPAQIENMGTDAKRWAEQFLSATDMDGGQPVAGTWGLEGVLRTWFANALEAGREAGSRTVADIDPHTLPTDLIDGLATLAHKYGGYRQIGEVARWMSQR